MASDNSGSFRSFEGTSWKLLEELNTLDIFSIPSEDSPKARPDILLSYFFIRDD